MEPTAPYMSPCLPNEPFGNASETPHALNSCIKTEQGSNDQGEANINTPLTWKLNQESTLFTQIHAREVTCKRELQELDLVHRVKAHSIDSNSTRDHFKCKFCPIMFLSGGELKSHLMVDHNAIPEESTGDPTLEEEGEERDHFKFKCNPRLFDQEINFKIHKQHCRKLIAELNEPQKRETTDQPSEDCPRLFDQEINFKLHKQHCKKLIAELNEPQKRETTDQPSEDFNKPIKCEALEEPSSQDETDLFKFQCSNCPMWFEHEQNLKFHEHYCKGRGRRRGFKCAVGNSKSDKHTDQPDEDFIKRFKCLLCHKAYSFNKQLKRHQKIHNSDRAHKCEICGKAFLENWKLIRHQKCHAEKTIPKACNPRSTVRVYSREIRSEAWSAGLPCGLCPEMFQRLEDYNSHMITSHCLRGPIIIPKPKPPEPVKNPFENQPKPPEPVTNPFKYKCEHCPRMFLNEMHLRHHYIFCRKMKIKKIRKKVEPQTSKKPTTEPLLKPFQYKCEHCPRMFSKEIYLMDHYNLCRSLKTKNIKKPLTNKIKES